MTMANEPSDASNTGDDNVLAQARLALENGRPEDAERIVAEMLKTDPHSTNALHILGCALTIQGRYDEAVEILSLGLQIAPTMPQLSIQLGYTHLSRSDCANANAAFARALEISPDSHDALF